MKVVVCESRFFSEYPPQRLKHHKSMKKQGKEDLSTDKVALYYYD